MEILSLLKKRLKDDEVMELLEWMDVRVVYDFDRSYENLPDVYWAAAKDHGITLRFDESQTLDTIFLYVQPIEDHRAADFSLIEEVPLFDSDSQVRMYAVDHGIRITTGSRSAGLIPPGSWVRLNYVHHQVHYEFREGTLSLITISSVNAPNAA
jgi:hypothetical protein